jgi:hypothetical protein
VNIVVISCACLGLFPVQLARLALIAMNTEEAPVKYLAQNTEAAVLTQLDNC